MIGRNIRTFMKHLAKHKLYTLITIFGFSASLMFVILISFYIKQEYSKDNFQVNKNRIFRLVHDDYSGFAPPTGSLLMDKYPEMEAFTRCYKQDGFASVNAEEKYKINYLMVDSAFFKMFSFPLLAGNPETALLKKSIVLTKSYAIKLFGKMPELGSIVKIDNHIEYTLGGIMDDIPENTHFKKADALVDFSSLPDLWGISEFLNSYGNNSFGLYVMEKPNTDITAKAPEILKLFKEVNWMYKKGYANEVVFEPLTDVYFSSSYSPGIRQNSKTLLQVLSAIVILILFLSVLNYINLTIAQAGTRSKEIAVKKLMGSKRQGILLQYTVESVLVTLFSFILALFLCFLVEPVFNQLLGTHLGLLHTLSWQFVALSAVAVIITGILSGIIPAVNISRFNPVDVVKGAFRMKSKNYHSKILIAFQYLIIIVLMISSLFISKQTKYMRNFDLGFNQSNILSIDNTISTKQKGAFKSVLESIPGVEHVCYVAGSPLDGGNNNSFDYEGKSMSFQTFKVDTSFFRMMGMKVMPTGTALTQDAIWLNETAVREMELPEKPVSVKIYGKESPVYGVVKDFHFSNLKETIGPAYFSLMHPDTYAWSILVKISGANTFETTKKIKEAYNKFTHGIPLNMTFMEEAINKWYDREEKIGEIVKYFTILTVIISVMGLFAMSLYYVQQKTKEIGIRKVNGARISEVISMLNKNFVKWVAIAFIVATPIAYYAMNKWLENFAYKTALSWWIFALAGVLALGIALLTVSWQSWKAATRNPVEALRYE